MLWVLDYLDVIASDLSAFHRVDDMRRMPAHRLFALAPLLPAYAGAVQGRLEHEKQHPRPEAPVAVGGQQSSTEATPAAVLKMKYRELIE